MFKSVQETKLDNGMRVITSALDHVQSVAVGLWIGVGSRHEPRAEGGISHFLEHLLFKGTPKRSALEISQAIEGRGGYLNAFTQEDSTCYYARAGFDRLAPSFDVLADMVLHASCAKADVEKERQVILEEILMYRDQPRHYVQELLQEAVWPGHALGRPVIGADATIGAMTAETIRAYKDRYYVPASMVAAFAGRVEHARCVDRVAGYFGNRPRGRRPVSRTFRPDGPQRLEQGAARDIEQTHLALGIRIFGRTDPRRYALRVLNAILGENMSSRLFQTVREKHGLAYSIHSAVHLFADTGMLEIAAGLDRRRSRQALVLILKELDRLRRRPVGAGELRRAKDYLIGQLRLGLESTSNQMMWIGENLLSYGRFMDPDDVLSAIDRVTAGELQVLSEDLLDGARMSVAVVSPLKDAMNADLAAETLRRNWG